MNNIRVEEELQEQHHPMPGPLPSYGILPYLRPKHPPLAGYKA
jgi:hypothetical protein